MKTIPIFVLPFMVAAIISFVFTGCIIEDENFAPTASFTVTPDSGNLQTVFVFDASGSADVEDGSADLFIRWDFNGDGSWDTDWITDKKYNIQYLDVSTYTTKLEVKDSHGLTAQSTQSITVSSGGGGIGTVTDPRDGYSYATKLIGDKTWMAENLRYESRGSWCYDNLQANCAVFGRLYDWEGAMSACPSGWHLASDDDWGDLELFLGMTMEEAIKHDWRGTDEGYKMKSVGGWFDNGNGSNSSGINAMPGGMYQLGSFMNIETNAYFWTSKEPVYPNYAFSRMLRHSESRVNRDTDEKGNGYSVRCVKD